MSILALPCALCGTPAIAIHAPQARRHFRSSGRRPDTARLLERTMSLRRKLSPGFSRAVNHLLRSPPGIRHATGAPGRRKTAAGFRPTRTSPSASQTRCSWRPAMPRLRCCALTSISSRRSTTSTAIRPATGSLNRENRLRCAGALAPQRTGFSASPLCLLTRRSAASWRACLSGSGCPFPCR